MTEPLVVRLAIALFYTLTPLLSILARILCFPQLVLKEIKLSYIKPKEIRNFVLLTVYSLFYLIYIGTHLNFHLILYFKYYLQINSEFQLVMSFTILNILTAFIYKKLDIKFFIKEDLPNFIYYMNYEILWFVVLFCVLAQLGFSSPELYNFLGFRTNYVNVLEIWILSILAIGQTLIIFIIHFMMLLHIVNPISLIRALAIIFKEYNWKIIGLSLVSVLHIIEDMFLIVFYLFNLLFPLSFLKGHKKLIEDIWSGRYKNVTYNLYHKNDDKTIVTEIANMRDFNKIKFSEFEEVIRYAELYLYIKHILIKQNFKANLKFFIGLILCALHSVFIWKIPNIYRLFRNFLKNDDFKEFVINFTLLFVETLIEILTPIVFIYNHLNPINFISLYNLRNYYKKVNETKKNSFWTPVPSFAVMNIFIFAHKGLDYLATFFSLNINFTFVILFLRFRKMKKRIIFFPLLTENVNFYTNGTLKKITNLKIRKDIKIAYNSLHTINDFFAKRRVKFVKYLLESTAANILLILCSISILDPFFGLKFVKIVYDFSYVTLIDLNGGVSKYMHLLIIFQTKLFKNLIKLFYDIIFYLPLILIILITSPWNFIRLFNFIFEHSISKPIRKIKNENIIQKYNDKKVNLANCEHTHNLLLSMIESWKNGWKIIIQIMIIHLTIFRGFLMWMEFFKLSAYKKERIKQFNNSNNSKMKLVRKHSINTENFLLLTDSDLFLNLISLHFGHCLRELIYSPFLLIIVLITPWNIFELKSFTKSTLFNEKSVEFNKILKKFIHDVFYITFTLSLLISIVKTVDVLRLIYYSFRKNFIRDEKSILLYDTYYKGDYASEIRNLSGGIFKNILIILMLILNILLIIRIFSVFRRLKAFIKKRLAEDYSKIKHIFDNKIPDVEHHFLHTSSNRILASICEFLPPSSVLELSLTSKILYNKTQMNLLWRNMFEYYYKKNLKNSTNPEIYNLINADNFKDYKSACKELSTYAGKTIQLTEAQRDSLIGVYNIMLEETINSILRIPHLILIPAKSISLVLFYVGRWMQNLQFKFKQSRFFESYLDGYYCVVPFHSMFVIEREYVNWNWGRVFVDAQILGVLNLFKILIIIISNIISVIFSGFVLLVKTISLTRISIPVGPRQNQTYLQKLRNINYTFLIVYQHLIAMVFVIIHIVIILYPLKHFYPDGFNKLISQNFSDNNGNYLVYLNPTRYFSFLYDVFIIWWSMGFFGRIYFLIGKWFRNFVWLTVNSLFIKFLKKTFQESDVVIYDIVQFVIFPNGLLNFIFRNLGSVISYGLFPQIILLRKLEKYLSLNNIFTSLIINLIYLFLMLFPFYLNFKIELNFYNFLMINCYATINMIKLIKK